MLKPQDIFILLKLVAIAPDTQTYAQLEAGLGLSKSAIHTSLKRSLESKLAVKKDKCIQPNYRNLLEFLIHGICYTFPPKTGVVTRGFPTAHAAPPLVENFIKGSEPQPVWADPEGKDRGTSIQPLYKSVPFAIKQDAVLYELLALVDAIRIGKAREKKLAINELTVRLIDKEKA